MSSNDRFVVCLWRGAQAFWRIDGESLRFTDEPELATKFNSVWVALAALSLFPVKGARSCILHYPSLAVALMPKDPANLPPLKHRSSHGAR